MKATEIKVKLIEDFIANNQFEFVGHWNKDFSFIPDPTQKLLLNSTPSIYFWLILNKEFDNVSFLYFGKAGKGIKVRMNQHVNGGKDGYLGSNSGRIKKNIIQGFINRGYEIQVWARKSIPFSSDIFKEKNLIYRDIDGLDSSKINVSLYSLEEEFFIALLSQINNGKSLPLNANNGRISVDGVTELLDKIAEYLISNKE